MIMATHKESFVVRNLAPVLILQTIPLAGEAPFFPFFVYNRAGEIQSMLAIFHTICKFLFAGPTQWGYSDTDIIKWILHQLRKGLRGLARF